LVLQRVRKGFDSLPASLKLLQPLHRSRPRPVDAVNLDAVTRGRDVEVPAKMTISIRRTGGWHAKRNG
jgi:hypothetical protein